LEDNQAERAAMSAVIWIVIGVVVLLALVTCGLVLFTACTARLVEQAVPPLGHFIEVDGARIHYIDTGANGAVGGWPPLLLIHGPGQMRNFTHSLLDPLKKDHRVVIIDRPGSGYSSRPVNGTATIRAQAESIARFAKALRLERSLVVGHSLGGAIALALALDHPDQVAGLVLLAPAWRQPQRVPPPFDVFDIASPLIRHTVAWTLATPFAIYNRALVLGTLFGPQPVPRDFATKGGGFLNLRPSAFISASRDLVESRRTIDDITARYASLRFPLGILYGANDRVLDATAQGETLAALVPGAEYEVIEGGGHMIPVASADRCAAFIGRMAQRLVAPTASRPDKETAAP
jgi:pimeloyl-ACP methyl ester carboxylesterase